MKMDEIMAIATEAMRENGVPQDTILKVVKDINQAAAEEEDAKPDAAPKGKNQLAIMLSDPNNKLAGLGDFVGWIVKLPEEAPLGGLLDRVRNAAKTFNEHSRAGRKNPIKTVGDAFQGIARRFWEAQDGTKAIPQTKNPVLVIVTDNKL